MWNFKIWKMFQTQVLQQMVQQMICRPMTPKVVHKFRIIARPPHGGARSSGESSIRRRIWRSWGQIKHCKNERKYVRRKLQWRFLVISLSRQDNYQVHHSNPEQSQTITPMNLEIFYQPRYFLMCYIPQHILFSLQFIQLTTVCSLFLLEWYQNAKITKINFILGVKVKTKS